MLVEEGDEFRAERLHVGVEPQSHTAQHIKYLTFAPPCAMTIGMLDSEKILITGATGKIAFPIARALAQRNEVWGAARLRDESDRQRLAAAGITPLALDMSKGDFSALPDDFSYVFHAAVDTGAGDWGRCVETNAQNSGELLYHCRSAKGFVFCSTGSVYGYQGQRPLRESRTRRVFRCGRTTASRKSPPRPCAPGSPRITESR